jgi:hypothetical protein
MALFGRGVMSNSNPQRAAERKPESGTRRTVQAVTRSAGLVVRANLKGECARRADAWEQRRTHQIIAAEIQEIEGIEQSRGR